MSLALFQKSILVNLKVHNARYYKFLEFIIVKI